MNYWKPGERQLKSVRVTNAADGAVKVIKSFYEEVYNIKLSSRAAVLLALKQIDTMPRITIATTKLGHQTARLVKQRSYRIPIETYDRLKNFAISYPNVINNIDILATAMVLYYASQLKFQYKDNPLKLSIR